MRNERVFIVSTDPLATLRATDFAPWTVRGLIASHKLASVVVAVLCVGSIAVFLWVGLGPKASAVTDSTTCAQWGSTNVDGQNAYARLYVKEHGAVAKGWGPAPQGVINAINAGCYEAFGEDVSDTATVVQAISRSF
ncbi:MAG: hypothetical protein WCC03_18485 [Candidatus Acidiferrales bacterium]